ncbi:MAG: helix-turn-helix domain-containing protein [Solirubrobacterales bacterium]
MSADRGSGLSLVPVTEASRPASTEGAEFSFAFPPPLLDALADRLAPRVAALLQEAADIDQWLDSGQAADYLGMTKNALHKLTSAREVPFEQDGPGCKLHFRRSELDRWRSGGRPPK